MCMAINGGGIYISIYYDVCNKTAGFTIIIRIDTSIGIRQKYPWATEFMFSIRTMIWGFSCIRFSIIFFFVAVVVAITTEGR